MHAGPLEPPTLTQQGHVDVHCVHAATAVVHNHRSHTRLPETQTASTCPHQHPWRRASFGGCRCCRVASPSIWRQHTTSTDLVRHLPPPSCSSHHPLQPPYDSV